MKDFNKYFDHTLLKADAKLADIRQLCSEAIEYDFASVCVNGCYVADAVKFLADTDINVTAVAGFPLGAMTTAAKLAEVRDALENGADEIDVVINVGAVKEKRQDYVRNELSQLTALCHEHDAVIKVILETCLLTSEEIMSACRMAVKAGADFVKTSTGFSTGGAEAHQIRLMKKMTGDKAKIKAAGGIRTLEDAKKMIDLEREKALNDLRASVTGLAMTATAKLLSEQAGPESDKKRYQAFLASAGEKHD